MPKIPMPPIAPVSYREAMDHCRRIERERGIALLIPGDLHLWGVEGGNRSDFFAHILETLEYDKVVLLGDMFDGMKYEQETHADRRVLELLAQLDCDDRIHIVRGNHDRAILNDPQTIHERARSEHVRAETGEPMDLSWLTRSRMYRDVVYVAVDGGAYRGPAHHEGSAHAHRWPSHVGSNDVLVLRVADKHILFEHGDAHDKWARRAHKSSVIEYVGKCGFDLLVRLERNHSGLGDMTGSLKQKVSRWRGVCRDVAQGAYVRGHELDFDIHANVCGHTHYPGQVLLGEVTHVNVGSFRGYRPSFALVTRDGELLPPIVVRYGRE